jgi:hypothetical protein
VESAQRSKNGKETGVTWSTVLYTIFLTALIVFDDLGKLRFLVRLMDSVPFGDKFAHFFLIGMLSFLLNRTVIQLFVGKKPKQILLIVTSILLMIFTIEEASQSLFNRHSSFYDLAASYAGIVTFALLAYQTLKRSKAFLVTKSAG